MGMTRRRSAILAPSAIAGALAIGAAAQSLQTLAPHEQNNTSAPPAIVWDTPPLPRHPVYFDSAEERHLRVSVVARDLEQPWSIAFLPNGDLLVTERPGRLRIIHNGELDPRPVPGTPAVSTQGARGLQGLMDIALHPRFKENHFVYLTYHKPVGEQSGATTLARGTWTGRELVGLRDIFQTGATDSEASRVVFGPGEFLYMSVSGPGGGPDTIRAQEPADYAGKVIRLRDDGSIPDDDPFVGRPGYGPAIFTMGHRNGHGLAVNPETGDIWETEQGPNGGDEINILRAGSNYGWPLVSFGRDYWGSRISQRPSREGIEDPAIVWLPSIGLTGMTFYTGDQFPRWKRNLFVTGLREGGIPRTGQIQRIVFNDQWEELRREPMLQELKQRMRDIRQGPDGLLYVLTAENRGAVLRIEPAVKSY